MAERRPLALVNGRPSEMPLADTIPASALSVIPQTGVTNLTTDLAAKVPLSATVLTNSIAGVASGALTLSTTATDIPGATVTITTVVPNTVVIVMGVFDFTANNTTGAAVATGLLVVDGSTQSTLATFLNQVTGTTAFRATVTQNWRVTLASAGSHTLKLQASRTSATAGTHTVNATHTTITVLGRF